MLQRTTQHVINAFVYKNKFHINQRANINKKEKLEVGMLKSKKDDLVFVSVTS